MNIIPLPTIVEEKEGSIALGKNSVISGAFVNTKALLKEFLADIPGGENCRVFFEIDRNLQHEAYRILRLVFA